MRRTAYLLLGLFLFFGMEIPMLSITPGAPVFSETEVKQDPQFDEATYEKLQNIQVDVSWKKLDLLAALGELTDEVQKADPAHGRIEFWLVAADAAESGGRRKINVVIEGVPVWAVLGYLSEQARFDLAVHKDSVLVRPLP